MNALGRKSNGKHSREQQGARWVAAEGYSAELEELEADFRGMVRRLRQSPLRRATPDSAAPGELWRQVADPMRDNTPKKNGIGYKAQWLAPFFQSRLWQGHWTCEAYGLRADVVAQEYHLPD